MRQFKIKKGYTLFTTSEIHINLNRFLRVISRRISDYTLFDIVCPVFLDRKGCIFYHGGGFTMMEHIPYPDAQGEEDINQFPNIREVEFSPLWAFIISDRALKKLGPIPEFGINIFTHADFIIRAQKAGFKIAVDPKLKVDYLNAYIMADDLKRHMKNLRIAKFQFEKKFAEYLDKPYHFPTMFHTHTGYPGGYCMHARNLLGALLKKKIKLYYKFIGGTNDDEPASDCFPIDDLRQDMGNFSLPQVTLSTGLNCFSNSGKYKIGFTTTEVDGVPENWTRVLNEMNEIWTTSEFSVSGLRNSGVKKPIFNMREGIDPNYFHPGIKPFKNNTKKKFMFISNFAWGRRKGIDVLFEAFSKEFSDYEDVVLAIKCLPSYWGHDIKKDIEKMYNRKGGAPIVVWDTVLPSYLLGGLYTAGHCFVFPSRGEGFGIPPLEALACGVPVIVSGYSALTEYTKRDGKKLPGVEFINGHVAKFDGSDSIYYHGFDWFQPSVSHFRYLMRKVYTNWKKYKEDAMKTSEYIRKEWTWDKSADLVVKRLEYIYKNKMQ